MICHLIHAFTEGSVCWRSNFSSENYDMLPCVIPFRKYVLCTVYTFFSHEAICICQLQFSSCFFLSICFVMFAFDAVTRVVWWVRCFAGALQMFIANFLIYFSQTLSLCLLQLMCLQNLHISVRTHTQIERHYKPLHDTGTIRARIKSHRLLQCSVCDLIEPECENLRMNGLSLPLSSSFSPHRELYVCVSVARYFVMHKHDLYTVQPYSYYYQINVHDVKGDVCWVLNWLNRIRVFGKAHRYKALFVTQLPVRITNAVTAAVVIVAVVCQGEKFIIFSLSVCLRACVCMGLSTSFWGGYRVWKRKNIYTWAL